MTYLECKIFPGGFSGELAFQLKLDDGKVYESLAPRRYFWDKNGKPVATPSAKGVDGYLAVRILQQREEERVGGRVLVSTPDGEVIKINKNRLVPYAESPPHVPVGP